jgi:hypothetical protein
MSAHLKTQAGGVSADDFTWLQVHEVSRGDPANDAATQADYVIDTLLIQKPAYLGGTASGAAIDNDLPG